MSTASLVLLALLAVAALVGGRVALRTPGAAPRLVGGCALPIALVASWALQADDALEAALAGLGAASATAGLAVGLFRRDEREGAWALALLVLAVVGLHALAGLAVTAAEPARDPFATPRLDRRPAAQQLYERALAASPVARAAPVVLPALGAASLATAVATRCWPAARGPLPAGEGEAGPEAGVLDRERDVARQRREEG